ncbi:MAG: GMC family oxidoreductase N-terminal domain-containing protein [Pseudomonadota bacterium]
MNRTEQCAESVFDYVIVGGGSAGCAIAARLSEDPDCRVCLLEAGPDDSNPLFSVPMALSLTVPSRLGNWAFETVPQAGLNGRRGYQPRGKVLGGSSSINAMIAIRGHRQDYDRWISEGAEGWGYSDVLPHFRKLETFEGAPSALHGIDGPVAVSAPRTTHGLNEKFIQAGIDLNIPENNDFNGERQEGIGLFHLCQRNGRRASASKAYLSEAKSRPNLSVSTKTHVETLLFQERRAIGVSTNRGRYNARREVILCAGAIQTPQILMCSGIGPQEELKKNDISVLVDSPNVGRNLQDHLDVALLYRSRSPRTSGYHFASLVRTALGWLPYLRHGRGAWTTNFNESGAFLRTSPTLNQPDVQLHFATALIEDHGRKLQWGRGVSCHVCGLRPKSRGSVRLNSPSTHDAPLIDPNYLSHPEDIHTLKNGLRIANRVMTAPAMSDVVQSPTDPIVFESDEALCETIRERADTIYHPVGTCRMGKDTASVVDPFLNVRGVTGLRVADASVMPSIVSGNTNLPTIMIGERAADFIRREQ